MLYNMYIIYTNTISIIIFPTKQFIFIFILPNYNDLDNCPLFIYNLDMAIIKIHFRYVRTYKPQNHMNYLNLVLST